MFRNYLKTAWRSLTRNRFYSVVNIAGLTAGIAFSMLIGAYIWSAARVNTNLKNAGRQYILLSKWKNPTEGYELTAPGQLARALRERYPSLVANYYRWDGVTSAVSNSARPDRTFREGLQICDSTMFGMYGFRLLYGNPETAFHDPYSLVITEDKAIKYFGRADVLGQSLQMENFSGSRKPFRITGVMAKPPKNSVTHITDDNDNQIYVSSADIGFFGRNMDWPNPYIASYIELQPGVSAASLELPIRKLIADNGSPQMKADLHCYPMPLKEYYLSANNGIVRKTARVLAAIALFILAMAAINFVNISIGRASFRLREIGVRKVMGGFRRHLILQFLTESILLSAAATVLGIFIYMLARSFFSGMLGEDLPGITSFPLSFAAIPFAFAAAIGIAAGIYPAFVLSSFGASDAVKGKLANAQSGTSLRRALVTFQCCLAIMAFAGAYIISAQVNLFFSKALGYDKELLVTAGVPRDWSPAGVRHMEYVRGELAHVPGVSSIALSYDVADRGSLGQFRARQTGADSASGIPAETLAADGHFAATYRIPLLAGTFFSSPAAPGDSAKTVINRRMSEAMGWKDPALAIGKQLMLDPAGRFTVVGVTEDFHLGSMQAAVNPSAFIHLSAFPQFRYFSIRLQGGDVPATLAAIGRKWNVLLPGSPFEFKFQDDWLRDIYKTELQLKKASYSATLLSLSIVLLGVLGVVSLSVQKRAKEIGIRKVLGSSVGGIVGLFAREISWVVLAATVIACPLTFLIMKNWLNSYAYRVQVDAWPFLWAAALCGGLTLLVAGALASHRALENPVDSLRTE